ncbi:hypothetical protein [Marinospirillum insulare]|uniref:Uncharacterized protein n=1 Tax=Marinospirillum insulare TaxID=217169 RepID=A0ABQ5ZXT5_9GAMM|nr:hypothetical protein [Marinospirillum insulare]GLR65005.1 hypothetical protein GCM10007878_24430 [Marinospirillum insulare]
MSQIFSTPLNAKSQFTRNLNKQEVDDWVAKQLAILRDLFPNAILYFLVPSEFYNDSLDKGQLAQADELIESAVRRYNHDAADEVIFIRQDYYPSVKYICDTQYHANERGRTWRTNKLIEQISKKQNP